MPTDTIYGLLGSALNKKTVAKIYKLRRRNTKKPLIVLIGSATDLEIFGIKPEATTKRLLKKFWPGKTSIILSCRAKKFTYLHRGAKTLAFRLPKTFWLRKLLVKTGPLVAPSANWEGELPALTINDAKKYFDSQIDFYINAGKIIGKPSRLIKINSGKITVLRK